MIRAFQAVVDTIQVTGDVQPGQLASGIWEALITTAAGLCVAIPAFVGQKYLEARVDRYVVEMEERADIYADYLAGQTSSLGEAPRHPESASEATASGEAPAAP